MINNGKNPTVDMLTENGEILNNSIISIIRNKFDHSMTSQEASSWIILSELYGYKELAEEMKRDLETELTTEYNFDFGDEKIPDENIHPDTY